MRISFKVQKENATKTINEIMEGFKEFGEQTGGAVDNMTAKAQELGATAAKKGERSGHSGW